MVKEFQMRVAGMPKLIHTAQSPREFNVEEQLLKSCDWDKWDELFKDILILIFILWQIFIQKKLEAII